MTADSRRSSIGVLLLLVSTVLLLGAGPLAVAPAAAGGVAALGLAAGALAFGTSGDRRPV